MRLFHGGTVELAGSRSVSCTPLVLSLMPENGRLSTMKPTMKTDMTMGTPNSTIGTRATCELAAGNQYVQGAGTTEKLN